MPLDEYKGIFNSGIFDKYGSEAASKLKLSFAPNTPTVNTQTLPSLKVKPVSTTTPDGEWAVDLFGGESNAGSTPPTTSDIGLNLDTFNTAFKGLSTLAGLANAYMGYKNYQLAKDQFGFEKAAVNRNIANTAQQINNQYDAAGRIAAGMTGLAGADGKIRQDVVDYYSGLAKKQHVDGSAIG